MDSEGKPGRSARCCRRPPKTSGGTARRRSVGRTASPSARDHPAAPGRCRRRLAGQDGSHERSGGSDVSHGLSAVVPHAPGQRSGAVAHERAVGPPADVRERSRIGDYLRWLARERGAATSPTTTRCGSGRSTDLAGFWRSIWDYFEVIAHDAADRGRWPTRGCRAPAGSRAPRSTTPSTCCGCPGVADDDPVVLGLLADPGAGHADRRRAARAGPPGRGPGCAGSASARGDRVAAYAPNIPETFVLHAGHGQPRARSSPAARRSSAPASVVDRWQQIEPKVLVAVDGYRYGDKAGRPRAPRWPRSGPPCRRCATPCMLPYLDPAAPPDGLRGPSWPRRPTSRSTFDAGAVRPPALRALLLRHHRAAQADRARPRRHPAGAPEDAGPAPRPRPGRPVLLVHHHRLDDVELPGLRPGGRARRSCCSTATPATPTWARCGGWPRRPA